MDNRNDFITFLLGADTDEGYEKLLKTVNWTSERARDCYNTIMLFEHEVLIDRDKEYHGSIFSAKVIKRDTGAVYLALFINNQCLYCEWITTYEEYLEHYV